MSPDSDSRLAVRSQRAKDEKPRPSIWMVIQLLDRRSRLAYSGLAALSIASSLLQTVGVASVSLLFTVLLGGRLPERLDILLPTSSFGTLAALVLCSTLAGTCSSALATYLGIKLSWRQYHVIACRLLEKYVLNPYEWHLEQNSARLTKAVINDVNYVVTNVLQQMVLVLVRGSEICFIAILLISTNPLTAISAMSCFALAYGLLFISKQEAMRSYGTVVTKEGAERQKAVSEALGGIKSLKVSKNHSYFLERFRRAALSLENAQSSLQYLSLMPKYFIEALLFGGLVGYLMLAQAQGWSSDDSVSVLALFGAAAIRMLPAAQQVYASCAILVGATATLDNVCEGILSPMKVDADRRYFNAAATDEYVLLLDHVSYGYPAASHLSLIDLTLSIKKGEKLGVVGATGAGKTTFVDIMLGLLPPSSGVVSMPTSNQDSPLCGYVPQHLHFVDDTIAANIALGVEENERDFDLIVQAAKEAKIHDHIESLPNGYQTQMGEQAVRFSGGQRQRLGIARALYRRPAVLILDEASNALDPETERRVIASLQGGEVTTIIIAHRISLLQSCDRIVVLNKGRIESVGSFESLLETSSTFRTLAQADAEGLGV